MRRSFALTRISRKRAGYLGPSSSSSPHSRRSVQEIKAAEGEVNVREPRWKLKEIRFLARDSLLIMTFPFETRREEFFSPLRKGRNRKGRQESVSFLLVIKSSFFDRRSISALLFSLPMCASCV